MAALYVLSPTDARLSSWTVETDSAIDPLSVTTTPGVESMNLAIRWRYFWHERLPFWIAKRLPARVAYFAFIRVHAASEVDWSFDDVAREWERRYGR